jgi:hypothetical protein
MNRNIDRRLARLQDIFRPAAGCPTCATWTRCVVSDTQSDWSSGPQRCPDCGADGPIVYTFADEIDWTLNNCDVCFAEVPSTRDEILANLAGALPCVCPACMKEWEAI